MARFFKKRIENKGLSPGSLVFIGTRKVDKPSVEYIAYNEKELLEKQFLEVENLPKKDTEHNQWYNITGLHNVEFMQAIEERLQIHPLAMEDVMNTGQRAKFVDFPDFSFVSLKMLRFNEKELKVYSEQISFVLREHSLVSFQEQEGDTFDHVRQRLHNSPRGNTRKMGPDYLMYALLDSVIDNYIYLIEHIGEKVDDLELKLLDNPNKEVLADIHRYKRELHFILKVAKPVVELVNNLLRSDSPFMRKQKVMPFYKDLADLVTHAIESVETYRNLLSDYINIYHTSMSGKLNEIIKVLTIFSAIFIPLSFFAGVFGTNFEHFPALEYRYAYPVFWSAMIIIAVGMLLFFRSKKWF